MINLEQQIFKQIEKAENILIVFLRQKNGDSLAASLALFLFLKDLNKRVDIIGAKEDKNKENQEKTELSFLPSFNEIEANLKNLRKFIVSLNIKNSKVSQIKYSLDEDKLNFIISPVSGWFQPSDVSSKAGDFKYDLIITVGINNLESLGEIYDNDVEFFYKTTIINLDNSAANEDFGQINFIDLNSATNSEIVYYLLKNYQKIKISEDVATCVLAGIIKKTRNFKSGNLSPKTLLTSSELISLGAKREDIIKNIFYSKNINSLKLWGEILKYLKSELSGEFLWSKINQNNIDDFSLNNEGIEEIIDELISGLPKAKVFIILTKTNNTFKIKVFSLKMVNCLKLLQNYNAKGDVFYAEGFAENISEEDLINNLKDKFIKNSS